jgi:transposase
MRRLEIGFSEQERQTLEAVRSHGYRAAREVTRAHILAASEQGGPDQQIETVLGVSRMTIWRTRSAYKEGGLANALQDAPRPGAPRRYEPAQEAEVVALACSQPPPGQKRWTIERLTEAARVRLQRPKLSLEKVRQVLKKKRAQALA